MYYSSLNRLRGVHSLLAIAMLCLCLVAGPALNPNQIKFLAWDSNTYANHTNFVCCWDRNQIQTKSGAETKATQTKSGTETKATIKPNPVHPIQRNRIRDRNQIQYKTKTGTETHYKTKSGTETKNTQTKSGTETKSSIKPNPEPKPKTQKPNPGPKPNPV